MGRNVEIKVRLVEPDKTKELVEVLADGPPRKLAQTDTFFRVPYGRLKLREQSPGGAELIHYERPDEFGPRPSCYRIHHVGDPLSLGQVLTGAHSVLGVVTKRRHVYQLGQTRVHIDRIEELGVFLELEVVLRHEQSIADGEEIAEELSEQLGLEKVDRVAGAYLDLLREKQRDERAKGARGGGL